MEHGGVDNKRGDSATDRRLKHSSEKAGITGAPARELSPLEQAALRRRLRTGREAQRRASQPGRNLTFKARARSRAGKVDQEDCLCRLKRAADEQSFQSQQLSIMAALPEMPRPTWSKLMMTTRQKFKS
jgi:hypothetical protein